MKAFTKRALLLTLLVLCLFGVTILGASAAATVTAGVTEKVDGTTYVASFDFVEGETPTTYWYTDITTAVTEALANGVDTVTIRDNVTVNAPFAIPGVSVKVVGANLGTTDAPVYPTITYTGTDALFSLTGDASLHLENLNFVDVAGIFINVAEDSAADKAYNIQLNNVNLTAKTDTDGKALADLINVETKANLTLTVNGGTYTAKAKLFLYVNDGVGDAQTINVTITDTVFQAAVFKIHNCPSATITVNNAQVSEPGASIFRFYNSSESYVATLNINGGSYDAGTSAVFYQPDVWNTTVNVTGTTDNPVVLKSAGTGVASAAFYMARGNVTLNFTHVNLTAGTYGLTYQNNDSATTNITLNWNNVAVTYTGTRFGYIKAANEACAVIQGTYQNATLNGTAITADNAFDLLDYGIVTVKSLPNHYYGFMKSAVLDATDDDVVYVHEDTTITSQYGIGKSITIEGVATNGVYPTIEWTNNRGFKPSPGVNFTLKNLKIVQPTVDADNRFMDRPFGEGSSTTLPTNYNPGTISFYNIDFQVLGVSSKSSYMFNLTGGFYATFHLEDCNFLYNNTTDNVYLNFFGGGYYGSDVTIKNCVFDGSIKFLAGGNNNSGTAVLDGCTIKNNIEANFVQLQAGGKIADLTIKNSTVSNNGCNDSNGAYFMLFYGPDGNVTLDNVTWTPDNTAMMVGCVNAGNKTTLTLKNMNVDSSTQVINLRHTHTLVLNVIGGTYKLGTAMLYTNDNGAFVSDVTINFNKDVDATTIINLPGRTSTSEYNAFLCTCNATLTLEMHNTVVNQESTSNYPIIRNRKYGNEDSHAVSAKFVNCVFNTVGVPISVSTEDTLTIEFEGLVMNDKAKAYEFGSVARIGNSYYSNLAAAAADAEEIGDLFAHTFFLNGVEIAIYLEAQTDLTEVAIGEGAALYYVNGSDNYYYNNLQAAVTAAPPGTTIIFVTDRALSSTAYINKQLIITAADGVVVTLTNGTTIPFVFNNGANVTFKNLTFTLANRLGRIDGEVTAINFVNCVINYAGDYFLYSNDSSNDPVTPEGGTPISKTMNVVFDEDTVVTGTAGMGIWINTPQITKNSRFIFKGQFSTTTAEEGALVFILDTAAATVEIYPTAVLTGSIFNPNGALIYRVGGAVNDDNAKDFGVPLKATDKTGVYYTNDYFFAVENLIDGEKIYEVPLTAEHSDKTFNINNANWSVNTANVVDFLFTMFPNLVRINDEVYYANLAAAIADYQTGDIIYILKDTVIIDTSLIDGKAVIIAGLNLGTTDAPVYPTISAGVNIFAFANGGSLTLQNLGVALSGGRVVAITEAGAAGALVFDNVHFTWIGSTTLSEPAYFMSCNGGFPTSLTIKNSRVDTPYSEKGIWVLFLANAEGLTVEVKDSVINAGVLRIQGAAIATLNLTGVSAEVGRSHIVANYGAKDLTVNVTDCALNVTDPSVSASFGACFYYSGDYVDTKLTTINVVDSIIATGAVSSNNYGYMFSANGIAGSVLNVTITGSILTQVNKACGIVYAKHTDVAENIAGSDTIVNISITDTTVTSAGGFITASGGKDNDAELIDNVININENTVLILNTEANGNVLQVYNNSRVNIYAAVTDGANDPVIYVLGQENVIDNQNNGYVGYFGGTTELNVYGGTIISTNGSDYIFAAIDSASITVYGGYLQHNGYAVMRAYGVDPTITIYGGTFVLEATHKGRGSQSAMSVIEVGASNNRIGNLYIYGGIFVNNNDAELAITGATTSRQVIYKSATGSTVVIEGGVFLATSVQDYFYYTAGNSGAGISLPVASAPILKGASPVYNFAGRDCYLYSYNMGTPVAPELDSSVTVRLYTDGEGNSSNGLRFTSSINDVIYGALISWVQNLAVEAGLQPNDYVLSFGTLVAPLDTLVEAGGFSVEAFEAAEIDAGQYVDIAATEKGMTIDENGLEIRVALVDIDPENYDKLITARPYVTVTLIEGGAEAADGTEPVSVTSYYGTFNTNKGASSISRAALRELNDVMAIRTGAYQYKSVTVEGGFSRYSKAQQEALLTFVAHKHNFNFKGECIDEGCDYTGATVLDVDDSTKIYCEYGGVSYITVNLEAGITYNFAFSRNIVRYALYDANGNDCTVSDNKFACTADGVYHMVITSTGIGSTELTLNHVHQADHTGYCSICEEDLSILVDVEENYQQLVTDGMTYYYAIELTGGVSYTVLTKNGYYTLYNEAGQVCTIVDGITFACPEDGTYYLTVVATFSATGGITVTHNHDYDYQGYCKIDYCDAYIGQSINLYQQIGGLVRVGDEYRLAIELEAGENYPITFTAFMGVASLYDAEGNKMELSNDGSFNCTESGTYYVSVSVQTDTTAYVYVAITHECEYDFKGVCGVCGDDVSVAVTDPYSEQLTVFAGDVGYYKVHTYKDTKYILSYPADVISVKVYTDNGEVTETDPTADVYFDPTTGTYFNKNEDGTIYVVATVLQDAGPVVGVAHVHEYDFKGDCTVTNCGDTAATSIKSFNSAINATWVTGETYYYSFYMTAGRFYNVVLEGLECDWVVKNGENKEIFQDDAVCFTLDADATCYLIVTATADAEGKIKITEAATHAIDFTGDCTVEGCEYDEGREITITEDATVTSYNAEGGQTLYASVQLAEGYTYTFVTSDIANAIVTLYDAQGNVIIPDANNAYTGNNATVYIQILVIGAHEGTLTITRTAVAAPAPAPAA